MNKVEKKVPFSEDYWKEDGGQRWADMIDATENSISVFDDKLFEKASISEGEIVLDVGCGGGTTSIEIAQRVTANGHVTGLDISVPILNIARQRGKAFSNLEFEEADAADFNPGSEVYDLIFSRFGLMFFSKPVDAFSNLKAMLKQSGRIVFLCWRTFDENPWMKEPAEAVFKVIPPQGPAPGPDAPGPFSLGDRGKIENIMNQAGYKAMEIEAIDINLEIGNLEETVNFFTRMGPAASLIAEADEDRKQAAITSLTESLRDYETAAGVSMPGAAWIVSAINK